MPVKIKNMLFDFKIIWIYYCCGNWWFSIFEIELDWSTHSLFSIGWNNNRLEWDFLWCKNFINFLIGKIFKKIN
jgi:hypothetical protein